jgi:acetylornithine/N-succinyldiaminopimelate aminotransferase
MATETITDNNKKIFETGSQFLMPTYSRIPVVFTAAKMQYLWDANGEKYTDFIAGLGCLNVGHSNPYVVKAVKKQAGKIIQLSNYYFNEPQVELAQKLCRITEFGEKVFFANSGTEAIEGAIKLARKYSVQEYGPAKYKIVSFDRSFHGRTMGALSATAQEDKQNVFRPLLEGFEYAKLNDISSVKSKLDGNVCAILIEPVQGEGGINVCDLEFIKELRKICTDNNILLIFDEVQTGFGRTGKMFAFQNFGIYPDILVLAKSLGGGMPIGAIVSTGEISRVFEPGSHGSTFGGNAASCAAGVAVIDYMIKNNLVLKAKKLGKHFFARLMVLKEKHPVISDVRGMGLMIGVEFSRPIAWDMVAKALEDKIVINKTAPNILRFLPPLVTGRSDIDMLVDWLDRNLKNF